ncbi:MAG: hypothetical protein WD876_01520 [Candidatus Pacearchaeota archaeon]
MPTVTISIDAEVQKIIGKRAKKNILTIKEQVEEIVRQSAVRTKSGAVSAGTKADDRLVDIFSRNKKSRKGKKKTA